MSPERRERRALAVAEAERREADRAERKETAKLATALIDARIPREHARCQYETAGRYEKWAKLLDEFSERLWTGFTAALLGSNGPGKTQLGVELIRRACHQFIDRDADYPEITRPALYVDAVELFATLREAFNVEGATESGQMSLFTTQRLLVIDEFDKPPETKWIFRMATTIIDRRSRACLGTLLIANQTEPQFEQHLGPSAWSRLSNQMGTGGVAVANWPSFRKAVR